MLKQSKENFTFANYAMMTIDGGLFMGGLGFLAAQTLMPKMIQSLGGPIWLIDANRFYLASTFYCTLC